MTNKELIKQLQNYPENAMVFTHNSEQFPASTYIQLLEFGKEISILDSVDNPKQGDKIIIIY